jgi:hypothetical protein
MNDKPSFYAVIPASVRYDTTLSSSEKLFYAEITAMSQKEGFCWASNSYFSDLFGVSKNTVTRWVSNLKDNKHIVVNLIKEGKQITKREIYPINKIDVTYPQKSKGGTHKNGDTPTHKNGDDNNTSINTTSNNISVPQKLKSLNGFDKVWNEFIDHRKEIKKPMTDTSATKILNKLESTKSNPIDMLENSIMNGWSGVFDTKEQFKKEEQPLPQYLTNQL